MPYSEKHPRVSVVVPVYNVENYLQGCLTSIQNQKETDIEVIMVDDGSTDRSAEIAKSFLADPRFRYIRQENAGVSVARSRGIEEARGEWTAFVDSDDELTEDNLSTLLTYANDGADIICCGCGYKKDGRETELKFYPENAVFSDSGASEGMFHGYTKRELYLLLLDTQYKSEERRITAIGVPWAKIFRTAFLKENRLSFEVRLKRLQDNMFNMHAMKAAGKVYYIDQNLYRYNTDHLTNFRRKFDARAPQYYDLLFELRRKFLTENNLFDDPEIRLAFCREVLRYSGNMLTKYYTHRDNHTAISERKKEMRQKFSQIWYTEAIRYTPMSPGKIRLMMARAGMLRLLIAFNQHI